MSRDKGPDESSPENQGREQWLGWVVGGQGESSSLPASSSLAGGAVAPSLLPGSNFFGGVWDEPRACACSTTEVYLQLPGRNIN
jgi:hypothetical protein